MSTDVPLENAYFNGFYKQMTDFIRSFFESALKTNSSLEFAVITGLSSYNKGRVYIYRTEQSGNDFNP